MYKKVNMQFAYQLLKYQNKQQSSRDLSREKSKAYKTLFYSTKSFQLEFTNLYYYLIAFVTR
jgi:hypothetical protein